MRFPWLAVRALTDLLMAAALVLVGASLLRTGEPLGDGLTSTVWLVAVVVMFLSVVANRRFTARMVARGRWEERAAIVVAFDEAMRRGMTTEEFLAAYGERVQAEAMVDFGHKHEPGNH